MRVRIGAGRERTTLLASAGAKIAVIFEFQCKSGS